MTIDPIQETPAPNPNSLGARNVAHVVHGYGNLASLEESPPLVIMGGKGVHIYDDEGKEYIEGVVPRTARSA